MTSGVARIGEASNVDANQISMAQLVSALKSRDLSAQLYALTQLKNLSSSHALLKDTIREHGAIPPVVGLLGVSSDVQVRHAALSLLRSLSVNNENQRAIAAAGAIPLLYQCLQPKSTTTNGANNAAAATDLIMLQIDAAATLWNLTVDGENKAAIGETNGIALLLSTLARTRNAGLASEICGTLRNLANRTENLRYIVEYENGSGLALLASLLKASADDERMQKNATITLNLCLQHPDAADQLEDDTFDLLARLLEQYGVAPHFKIDQPLLQQQHPPQQQQQDPRLLQTVKISRVAATMPHTLNANNANNSNNHLMSSMVQGQQWAAAQNNRTLLFAQQTQQPVLTATQRPIVSMLGRSSNALVPRNNDTTTEAIAANNDDCFGTIAWRGLELGAKLGEGAFGVVYQATYHDYPVAVKIVHESLTTDVNKRDKLMFESRLLSMLHHPNVLLLLGTSITPDSRPVIVTEYCSLGTLKDVMAETASVLRRLQFARDIINGLNWLHAHNVVHRDLKPVNVLIDEHYRAKVADFGLSLVWFEGIHCTAFKGNVKYSANEVLAARADPNCRLFPYGPQTDIYSFGLMLWELVTNQPLFPGFRGKTAKSAITKYVCSGHRPPLSAGWPRSLQTMLSNCWHSDPTQRPKIGAVKRDFQQVLVDLICPDKIGRKVARALWLGQETRKVPYNEFERVFTDITQVDLGTASFCFRRCLSAMLCDSFDNTITFERFCNLLHYFDSLTPIDAFWNRLVTLFDQPWFFGFVPAEDARAMLIEHWRQTRQGYYMMRFSSTQPGSYSLYAIDTTGLLTHWRIGHLYSSEFFIPIDDGNNGNNSATNTQQQQQTASVKPATQKPFGDLLTLHAHCLQLPSMLKDKKAMPGSPCQCFFASNPLASTENL